MLRDVRSVVLGLSGGADSTALLLILRSLGTKVHAIHCNFHLRGGESDRDMAFCIGLCKSLDVPLEIVHFDVPAYMASHDVALEEACRDLRYAKFREMKNKLGADRIAVAHNADDNIETLFLNLFRGSGISGLRGMLPDTGEIIRPLLHASRNEILEYLNARKQEYITDSSNLSDSYRRNFIRNTLLPQIEERWPGVRKAVTTTIANLRHDEVVLNAEARGILENLPKNTFPFALIKGFADPEWLIHRWGMQYGIRNNIASEIALALASDEPIIGKRWKTLSGVIIAAKDSLRFAVEEDSAIPAESQQNLSWHFDIQTIEEKPETLWPRIISAKADELWLPHAPENYIVRHPRPGDRIEPLGMKGSALVADILRDAGVAPQDRKKILLVCDAATGTIIWIPTIKRSRRHLLSRGCSLAYLVRPKI